MGKLLLTSGQVSVLLSSFIIFSCTLALFLSGYVIQQRTLAELRVAIRPREPRRSKPQFHLPEQFRTTAVLEDGTVVEIESQVEREAREYAAGGLSESPDSPTARGAVIEVRPTVSEGDKVVVVSSEKAKLVEILKAQVKESSWMVDNPDPLSKNKLPLTRAERRKMIKDEIQRLSSGTEKGYYQRRLW